VVFILLSLVATVGGLVFVWRQPSTEPIEILPAEASATPIPSPTALPTATPAPLRIYITGAVVNSDVYYLPPGSIIRDAIAAAGGLTSAADPERINQALELRDQQQIHIPHRGEDNPPPPVQGGQDVTDQSQPPENSTGPISGSQINLNTATLDQLDALPGIGPAIAQRILDYRENAGGFSGAEEITQVSGIGEATFAKIKDMITVE